MNASYDPIAQEYRKAKQQPWRTFVEAYTVASLVGDLSGKSVLDLACGEGYSSRLLKRQGAKRVVGVDLSAEMIALARKQEARQPLGIEYLVHDAKVLQLNETFDLVTGDYLLCNARSREELAQMYQTISRHLKPGGRFVGMNNNPGMQFELVSRMRKYGFSHQMHGPRQDGAPVTVRFFLPDTSVDITVYYLSAEAHQWAAQTAGLKDLRWPRLCVSDEGKRQFGPDYWTDLLRCSPVSAVECCKE